MKTSLRFLTLMAVAVLASSAGADILVLDFNNNPEEVKAAERAAAATGRKVWRIPGPDQKFDEVQTPALQAARAEAAKADKVKEKACGNSASDECKSATADYQKKYRAMLDIGWAMPHVKPKNLEQELAKLRKAGVKITSLVVSAHDGDRQIEGVTGAVMEAELEKAFACHPDLVKGLRSAILAGCYTGTANDFLKAWKGVLPSKSIIAGAPFSGPAGWRPENAAFIQDVLEKEHAMFEAKNDETMKSIVAGIKGIASVNPAICKDRETVFKREGKGNITSRKIAEDNAQCEKLPMARKDLLDTYYKYLAAEEAGFEVTPENSHSGKLRELYNYQQKTEHCAEHFQRKGVRRPSSADVRRILFDRSIRGTFTNRYRDEIKALNSLLAKLGSHPSLQVTGFANPMTRKDYLEKVNALQGEYIRLTEATKGKGGFSTNPNVLALGYYVEGLQKLERGDCIPLGWVVGGAIKRDSACGIESDMREAVSRGHKFLGVPMGTDVAGIPASASPTSRAAQESARYKINCSDPSKIGGNPPRPSDLLGRAGSSTVAPK
jgi:hypothetical protein